MQAFDPIAGLAGGRSRCPGADGALPADEALLERTSRHGDGSRDRAHRRAGGRGRSLHRRLVRGGVGGPAGLLWVRQGNTGLDRRRDDDGEKRARQGILSSVRGEVEAITGGRRMTDIRHACQDELARLMTPTGRAKAGGAYASLSPSASAGSARSSAAGGAARMRAALDRRREIRRRLAELAEPDEERSRRDRSPGAESARCRRRPARRGAEGGRDGGDAAGRAGARCPCGPRNASAANRAREPARPPRVRRPSPPRRIGGATKRDPLRQRSGQGRGDRGRTRGGRRRGPLRTARGGAAGPGRGRAPKRGRGVAGAGTGGSRRNGEAERAAARARARGRGDVQRLERLEADIAGLRAALPESATSLRIEYAPGHAGASTSTAHRSGPARSGRCSPRHRSRSQASARCG